MTRSLLRLACLGQRGGATRIGVVWLCCLALFTPGLPAADHRAASDVPARVGQMFKDCSDCPEMVVIGPGSFEMGSPASEEGRFDDEGPQHHVNFERAFALGRTEVTVGEFRRFVSASGYVSDAERHAGGKRGCYTWEGGDGKFGWRDGKNWRSPGFAQTEQHPVVCVSWNDARAYVVWLARRTGKAYRLPSEAEWEYAARGGTSTSRPWGDKLDEACTYANLADQSTGPRGLTWPVRHECSDGYWFTAPVGSYRANAFGLSDMIGNAWEWVEDVWHDNYQGAPQDGSVWNTPDNAAQRVLRGGSRINIPRNARSAKRDGNMPVVRINDVGFRIARVL